MTGEVFVLDSDRSANQSERDSINQLSLELVGYFQIMKRFNALDPVEVFQNLSSFSARASEMRDSVIGIDSRRSQNFRIKHIEPFLEECDRQFKFHSRITAIREMDAKLAGGRFA